MNEMRHLEFSDRGTWRAWLEEHHAKEDHVWLVLYKKAFRGSGLHLEEAVEEALCFGWIDGLLRGRDERTYLLRFTPRRRNSVWSMSNIERVERLIREGRMTEVGLEAVSQGKASGQWDAAIRREQVDVIPPDLEAALGEREGALASYRALSASRKKQIIYWLQSAKREATRQRRVRRIVDDVAPE